MLLTAVHKRERDRGVLPSNALNEKPNRNAPDFSPTTERRQVVRNREEREVQGTVTEQPPAKHASASDHIGAGTHDTAQSERTRGEWLSLEAF